jgi:hypothetical protein
MMTFALKRKKWERPGKKIEPWPKTGSTGDALWKPYAPKECQVIH